MLVWKSQNACIRKHNIKTGLKEVAFEDVDFIQPNHSVYGLRPSSGIVNNYWLRLALSKGPKKVGVSFTSPENGIGFSFRNIALSTYLEVRTMNKVHEPQLLRVLYAFVRTV
jgi:hypothetical protein